MTHPVVQKPIIEPTICRDGSVDYTTSNLVDPLVSFDQVREYYDEQAKTLRTVLSEIYNSISQINSSVETFQSTVDRTGESFTLLQRTVNSQLDNIKHQFDQLSNQTTMQLAGFSDRMDGLTARIESLKNVVEENHDNAEQMIALLQKQMKQIRDEMNLLMDSNKATLQIANQASEIANHAREDVNVLRDEVFPKLENDLNCKTARLNSMILNEADRAKGAEKLIVDQVGNVETASVKRDQDLTEALTTEVQRASAEELKLLEMLKMNSGNVDSTVSTMKDSLKDLEEETVDLRQQLNVEISSRADGISTLQTALNSEIARANTVEQNLAESIQNLSGGSAESAEKLREQIGVLKEEVTELHSEYAAADAVLEEKLHGQFVEADKAVARTVIESLNATIENERDQRIAADDRLGSVISQLSVTVTNSLQELVTMLDSVKKTISSIDTDLNEKVSSLEARVGAIESHIASSTLEEDVASMNEMMTYLKMKFEQFDTMIDDKVNKHTATIIDRIETLDNRLDAQVRHSRAADIRLSNRISVLEGSPEEEKENEDDGCSGDC